MGTSIQIGANLNNTYFDYVNGVDNKDTHCGEKTLVDKKVSVAGLVLMTVIFYIIGILAALPILVTYQGIELIAIFSVGFVLSVFYTANPVGLKYRALGDITIFLCFGPLLMQFTSILLTGALNSKLNIYALPLGCIIECILHANNAR